MNAAHLHLLTNHLPVLGTLFGLSLLIVAWFKKSDELKKVSLGVFVVIALLAVPAYVSGEPAEDIVKNIAGISHAFIEEHEEAAQIAFTGIVVLGVVALIGLLKFRRGKTVANGFVMTVLLMAVAVSGLMAWTANLGGKILHPEIRGDAPASSNAMENSQDEH